MYNVEMVSVCTVFVNKSGLKTKSRGLHTLGTAQTVASLQYALVNTLSRKIVI